MSCWPGPAESFRAPGVADIESLFGKARTRKVVDTLEQECDTLISVLPEALPQDSDRAIKKAGPRQCVPLFSLLALNSHFVYKPLC